MINMGWSLHLISSELHQVKYCMSHSHGNIPSLGSGACNIIGYHIELGLEGRGT